MDLNGGALCSFDEVHCPERIEKIRLSPATRPANFFLEVSLCVLLIYLHRFSVCCWSAAARTKIVNARYHHQHQPPSSLLRRLPTRHLHPAQPAPWVMVVRLPQVPAAVLKPTAELEWALQAPWMTRIPAVVLVPNPEQVPNQTPMVSNRLLDEAMKRRCGRT